jgi:hypothetical protein
MQWELGRLGHGAHEHQQAEQDRRGIGEAAAGHGLLQAGTDLSSRATTVTPTAAEGETPDSPYQAMGQSWVNPFVGFTRGLTEMLDLTVRVQPSAPLVVRGKYQLSGENELRADVDNFSTAVSASAGVLLTGTPVTSFQFDGAFLAGYRPWKRHLFSLAPFFTFTSISGLATTAGAASGSLIQYGGGLGYQYSYENVFFRLEAAYGLGSSAENQVGGLFGGACLGFLL